MAILQWNIRSYHAHKSDLQLLCQEYNYMVATLQETRCGDTYEPKLPGFTSFNRAGPGGTQNGGITTLVHKSIPCQEVTLNTTLQALAVKVTLNATLTICNIYLPPSEKITYEDLYEIISQLPAP